MQPHVTGGDLASATIYALICPETGRIRYVGQTIQDPARRLLQHIRNPTCYSVARWLKRLAEDGKAPSLRVLERVAPSELVRRERFWISELRRQGEQLLNLRRGGGGCSPARSPIIVRMCENCGEAMRLLTHDLKAGRRFCSCRCQAQYRYRRKIRTCANCACRFRTKSADGRKYGAKYCSRKCYYGFQRQEAGHEALSRRTKEWVRVNPERIPRGDRRYNAKLTEQDVRGIRSGAITGTLKEVAARFGVSFQLVSDIRRGKRWKHVP